MLFHALYDAQGPDVYTTQLMLGLDGALESEVLQAAADALLQRHASLRAGFRHENLSRPVQIIVPAVRMPWRSIDLSLLDEAEGEARLQQILAEDYAERFDFSVPPLVRFTLIRLGADRHRLLLTSHHILMDGWSVPLVVQDLLTLYARRGEATALPRLTPYRDYLAWLAAQDGAAARAAWSAALAGLEEATLLAPHERGAAAALPEQIMLAVSPTLSAALTQQARSRGLTLNTCIQGAWAILLGRLTGRDDVVFGVTVAGRPPEIAGIERMVGLFINTLPLRLKLPAGQPLAELLRGLQDSQSRLMAHQHLGLAEIQRLTGLDQLFDTLVVFENYPVDRAGLATAGGDLQVTPVAGHDASHYPLSLVVVPGECLRLRLDYRPDLFDRETAKSLGGRLIRLLEAAVAAPERAIGRLDILGEEERRGLLYEWNETARAVAFASVPELFAAQVAKSPDAIAAVFADQQLSYAALEARANQLAHHLRALGVGPEVVVGLCVERSLPMLVGLLGILKAGGAYLPLDPAYPPQRLAFMLEDARAPVLVTQATLLDQLPAYGARIVQLDADGPAIALQPVGAPHSGLQAANTAYVIYTSGSTGTPKGVADQPWRHPASGGRPDRSLCHHCGMRVLQFASAGFRCGDREIADVLARRRQPYSAGRRCARRREPCACDRRARRQPCDAAAGGAERALGRFAAADADCGRRGVRARSGGTLVGGAAHDQRLRPDRDDGVRDDERGVERCGCAAARPPDLEHASLCFGRWAAACTVRGCWRALHSGSGTGAGLFASCWADGGAVCGGAVCGVGGPDVPQRGFGAVAARGGFGVYRPGGPAGEGSRVPH